MGNWRRAQLIGTCATEDLPILRRIVADERYNWHPLKCGGICGLPSSWPAEQFNVVGNLAERDYSDDQVLELLKALHVCAPSLRMECHLGGDYESDECVTTLCVADHGAYKAQTPKIEKIPELNQAQMTKNMFEQLRRPR